MAPSRIRLGQSGATLIEVLVTIVIIAFGLLGMAGLQMKMQASETEAFQRTQALLLVQDMAQRIAANRLNAASYVSADTYGEGMLNCPTWASGGTVKERDVAEWCESIKGAAVTETVAGVTTKQGAMIGGRGCIQNVGGDYFITVAWQGLTPVAAPSADITCGKDQYNSGTTCVNDVCRRVVTTVVRIATLI
jgi:type IV pilus assembly protein PilV